ncbi:hypothetical protein SESBI_46248 [Sesbania bispinosa]|nr:hypothetical protein SESBI_46248 [Sesbania bispinosa]
MFYLSLSTKAIKKSVDGRLPPQEQRTRSLNEPGFGIVSIKPLPEKSLETWPDQDRVKIKKSLRADLLKKAVANLDGYRSNLKGQIKYLDLNIPHCK